ncbi:MAG: aminopeptidase [Bdellovibrionia bacterium]
MQRPKSIQKIVQFVFLAVCSVWSLGCGSVSYLIQAGQGQWSLLSRARPIVEVLQDVRIPRRTRDLLGEIQLIKRFAEAHGIRPTGNYTHYVNLDRPAAVWVVSASPPLRFESKQWSFPGFGSFPYLGWFHLDRARAFQKELQDEGWDVDLRGAQAYSTLGWFKDPILSSMISEGPEALGALVNVVIHESVHATLYISTQSYFNESLASFVADRLTPVYLDQTRGLNSPEKQAYLTAQKKNQADFKRLSVAYHELEVLYSSSQPDQKKRDEKALILGRLKADLKRSKDLNNATLMQYKTYNTGESDFEQVFQASHENWKEFLLTLKKLNEASFDHPQQENFGPVLQRLR